ncbi:MAG: type II toxin-antitoxin system RelE/ParE family toxin [Clostridiales bacterium]|nr:type II toxin-antitoxin system RelE/ParE family toxin [Clostridiales bacterium]
MQYSIIETMEAVDDVINFASYMMRKFKNYKAADDFLNRYDNEVNKLRFFPTGYRGIGMEYRGYEIRIKPFGTYNIFFVIDYNEQEVIILRILKDRQNWNDILQIHTTYHFDE